MTETEAGRPRPDAAKLMQRIRRLAALPPDPFRAAPGAPDDSDAALIAACVAAAEVERRKRALFDGPARIDDDAARDEALDPLDAELRAYVEAAAQTVPATWTGHVVRAAAFLLWDAGGLHHQARLGTAGDRLLAAVVHDLVAS